MRAKEYAARYHADPTMQNLVRIGNDFIIEVKEIILSRGAGSNAAMFAAMNEQELKWQAFARLVDGVRADGFSELLKVKMPEVWAGWQGSKAKASDK